MKIESAEFVRSAANEREFLADGRPEVAFAGRSNVGKSSVLNCLVGQRGLARISSRPGRTQAVNYFLVNRRFYLVDLPGYGWAKAGRDARQEWALLVERFLSWPATRRMVLLLDAKVGATPLDEEALRYLGSRGAKPTLVATKVDRLSRGERKAAFAAIRRRLSVDERTELIAFSAKSGEGVGELWRHIASFLASTSSASETRKGSHG